MKNEALNRLIAIKVFKEDPLNCFILNYATDIKHAFKVIDVLGCLYFQIGREDCCGVRYDITAYYDPEMTDKVHINTEDLARGICIVALKLKGVEIEG